MEPGLVRYVFVDRDGVLNCKMPEGEYVREWAQFHWLPGAEEAIVRMKRAGFTVIVVSNQRGIALGVMTEDLVQEIHRNMQSALAQHGAQLDAIYYCPHDVGVCRCRKPQVGLFEQAFAAFPQARAENSAMIGDSLPDIEAGRRMGMSTIFIQGEPERQKGGAATAVELADEVANSLLEAVEVHLGLVGGLVTAPPSLR